MSKPEVNPEEINKGTLVAVAVAAVAVIGIALKAMRKGPKDRKTGSQDPSLFENLATRKPSGGRVTNVATLELMVMQPRWVAPGESQQPRTSTPTSDDSV